MRAELRQKLIAEFLQKMEFASLAELADLTCASISTVRRDLTVLESQGAIKRTHGGARLLNMKSDEFVFDLRLSQQKQEKEAIAKACVELIQPGQSIIIDAGTTAYCVAKLLEDKLPQIVTNSLPVANLFASNSSVEVVLTGGVIYPRLGVLVGPLAYESISHINADIAIMGAGGITLDGITNSHGLVVEIQRAMIKSAHKVIMCMDHSKFGRKSISPLCKIDEIDVLITDWLAPKELIVELEKLGLHIIIAKQG
jgi:DeoR/GlpR family transcriptional regulator of sugar metabolism